MGSDWAGETMLKLTGEFDICNDRALRITNLVRLFVSDPDYADVLAESGSSQRQEQDRVFIRELPETLREQPGETIEERWNNLMDARGIPSRVDEPVYLKPWSQVRDSETQRMSGYAMERSR